MSIKKYIVEPSAIIDDKVVIDSGCFIEAKVQIHGDVCIGKSTRVCANTIIYGPAILGEDIYIGPNSIIGFPDRDELLSYVSKNIYLSPTRKNVKIGNKVIIRSNCIIYPDVSIEGSTKFGHNVLIREGVKIGKNSMVGTNSIIEGNCSVGSNVSIQTGVYISTNTVIEDFVFLGPYCLLINDYYAMQKENKLEGPVIKSGASVGAGSIIFPKVIIGKEAVIGAGAVVRQNVNPRTIVVGIPARKIKEVPEEWKIKLKGRT